MTDNAKIFVGVRIPKEIMKSIQDIVKDTKRKQTDIIISLLERGLSTITDKPLTDNDWVSRLEFNELLERVEYLENGIPTKTAIEPSPKTTTTKGINKNKEEALKEIHANGWLTSVELCERIKRSFGDISRKSGSMTKEEFAGFTKLLDPDGIAWEKLPDKIGKFAAYKPVGS